jgi:hypothetical protein
MWLRRFVGVALIIACIGMNAIAVVGLIVPPPKQKAPVRSAATAAVSTVVQPTVTLSVSPSTIPAQTTSALSWITTGDPASCTASGSWSGDKTPFGAESTGRVASSGNYTYTLTCTNKAGSSHADATLTVGSATPPPHSTGTSTSSGGGNATTVTYCQGASPCYGPKEVAGHGSAGNCWGWNINRVIDISGLDVGYHQGKSGVSSIELSQICGHDLAPALNGQVSAPDYNGGQGYNHPQSAKDNSNSALSPYFIGYFDSNKP